MNGNQPHAPLLAVYSVYSPYLPEAKSYCLQKSTPSNSPPGSRPVPPPETWISEKYGKTVEEYLASGQRDTQDMFDILGRAGVSLEASDNILDFGCGDGRMIRWLAHMIGDREIWGTDLDAGRIIWCKQNLAPPFHF